MSVGYDVPTKRARTVSPAPEPVARKTTLKRAAAKVIQDSETEDEEQPEADVTAKEVRIISPPVKGSKEDPFVLDDDSEPLQLAKSTSTSDKSKPLKTVDEDTSDPE